MNPNVIVCLVDRSSKNDSALRRASALARWYGSTLHAVSVQTGRRSASMGYSRRAWQHSRTRPTRMASMSRPSFYMATPSKPSPTTPNRGRRAARGQSKSAAVEPLLVEGLTRGRPGRDGRVPDSHDSGTHHPE